MRGLLRIAACCASRPLRAYRARHCSQTRWVLAQPDAWGSCCWSMISDTQKAWTSPFASALWAIRLLRRVGWQVSNECWSRRRSTCGQPASSRLLPILVHAPSCHAARSLLARLGDKWSILIIVLLRNGPKRFNEMKRTVNGIS